jgi:hypothetical protein
VLATLLSSAALLLSSAGAKGSPLADVACPLSIAVEQRAAVAGWEILSFRQGAEHPLRSVSFYVGHPSQLAELKPHTETSRKGQTEQILSRYELLEPEPEGRFITCGYEGTSLYLSRQLPPVPLICEVIAKTTHGARAAPALRCWTEVQSAPMPAAAPEDTGSGDGTPPQGSGRARAQ